MIICPFRFLTLALQFRINNPCRVDSRDKQQTRQMMSPPSLNQTDLRRLNLFGFCRLIVAALMTTALILLLLSAKLTLILTIVESLIRMRSHA
jgi:hypothetical protein